MTHVKQPDDRFFAIWCGEGEAIWVFRAPQFDFEATFADYYDDQTSIFLRPWIKATSEILSFRNKARLSLDGQWRSPRYAEVG